MKMGYFHYSLTINSALYKAHNHFFFEIKRWSCLMNFFRQSTLKHGLSEKKAETNDKFDI